MDGGTTQRGRGAAGGAVALVAALFTALLVGCAGSSTGEPGRATSTSSPPSTSAPASSSSAASTSTTTTRAPTTTTTAPPRPGPSSMTLAFTGDLLPHLPLVSVAGQYGRQHAARYDFVPMLDPMRPIVEGASAAICHLEVPAAANQDQLSGYPSFGGPVELIDAVKATGYDGCSTASNHSLDQGRSGIAATLDRFDQVGLLHAGTARTADEGAAITMYDVGGAKVANLSYAYGFNGYPMPADAPFAANPIDVDRIHADATRARQAGAQLVVVSLHWGTEYQHAPDAYQRQTADELLPWPDIDVIVGHHAHVVQPIELVEGTYVVWGLGNHLANQRQVPRSDGLTAVLSAVKQPDGRYEVAGVLAVPTWIEPGTFRVIPTALALKDPNLSPGLRSELTASHDRTAAVLAVSPTPGVVTAPRP